MSTSVIEARGISLAFAGNQALADVDLSLSQSHWLGLIGPNGSGKSTMLNVLSGIYAPQGGTMTMDGSSLSRRPSRHRLRLGVARTFQHPQLVASLTLTENVMLGARALRVRRAQARDLARASLDRLGCAAFADLLPAEAPYGAQKMAEVARAMVSRPRVLLLDEPAAGLGAADRRDLLSALRACRQDDPDLAVCLIEHDVSLVAAVCDSLAVLSAGRLIARGAVSDVLDDPVVQEAYLGSKSSTGEGRRRA